VKLLIGENSTLLAILNGRMSRGYENLCSFDLPTRQITQKPTITWVSFKKQ
jgi:hypothetical protein